MPFYIKAEPSWITLWRSCSIGIATQLSGIASDEDFECIHRSQPAKGSLPMRGKWLYPALGNARASLLACSVGHGSDHGLVYLRIGQALSRCKTEQISPSHTAFLKHILPLRRTTRHHVPKALRVTCLR